MLLLPQNFCAPQSLSHSWGAHPYAEGTPVALGAVVDTLFLPRNFALPRKLMFVTSEALVVEFAPVPLER